MQCVRSAGSGRRLSRTRTSAASSRKSTSTCKALPVPCVFHCRSRLRQCLCLAVRRSGEIDADEFGEFLQSDPVRELFIDFYCLSLCFHCLSPSFHCLTPRLSLCFLNSWRAR